MSDAGEYAAACLAPHNARAAVFLHTGREDFGRAARSFVNQDHDRAAIYRGSGIAGFQLRGYSQNSKNDGRALARASDYPAKRDSVAEEIIGNAQDSIKIAAWISAHVDDEAWRSLCLCQLLGNLLRDALVEQIELDVGIT